MEGVENEPEQDNSSSIKKSKRIRNVSKSISIDQDESERNDSFSNSDDSEDEWNESRKKNCRRSKKTVPKQTLKIKLLEKTKMLQQLSKQSSVCITQESCKAKQTNNLQTLLPDDEEKLQRTAAISDDIKPSLDKDKWLKSDSSTSVQDVKCESLVPDISVKNESKKVIGSGNVPTKIEPIVIEYSINRSQSLVMDAPFTAHSQSYTSTNCNSNSISFQQTPAINSQRTPSITRLKYARVVKNSKINSSSIAGSKKVFQSHRSASGNRNTKNSNSKVSIAQVTTSPKNQRLSLKTNTNSVFNQVGNISPNGTVIHTGTGSVTITPRKVIPEKAPTQRKLFKNEIEGTISCRNIEGALRYVVNLANGTFIPLSDLQVEKLREQHKGALPIKLKIPVPCDVADKIEPSFLIED